ncbi:MAG: hypothetical protein COB02_00800 [Candidatus Cloacimonadota bacterium]|nr:MAG: hypothetical protein COB02_00800 [Candidatus Cloacimonadota bacterium]
MKLRGLFIAGLLVMSMGTSYAIEVDSDFIGKRTPPKAPSSISTMDSGIDASVLAEIASELTEEDADAVLGLIDQIYLLRKDYVAVLEKEIELKKSKDSDAQQALMKEYIKALNKEKKDAKALIETVKKDLEAHESRMLQVMAKIFRIGDKSMKTTINNVRVELKKFVRYSLMNNQGEDRAFYMDAMRFLDQYFRM